MDKSQMWAIIIFPVIIQLQPWQSTNIFQKISARTPTSWVRSRTVWTFPNGGVMWWTSIEAEVQDTIGSRQAAWRWYGCVARGMSRPMGGGLLGGVIAGGGAFGLVYKWGRERNKTDKWSEYMVGDTYYELAWIGPCLTWKDFHE